MSGDDMAKRFERDTGEHGMTVLHDDGLYRHIRFKAQKSSFYWFDLITWPGVLTISSDMGAYVFSRTRDMFEFFRAGSGINLGYWAEKVTAHSGVKSYSEDKLRRIVAERIEGYAADHPGLADAVREEILNEETSEFEPWARSALTEFEHNGFTFSDVWEWDLHDYTAQFRWCCHAIRWGIGQYDANRAVSVDA